MNNATPKIPHFLRVVRALARVRGAALPLAAVATTVVAGAHCGVDTGSIGIEYDGGGGATTTTTGGETGLTTTTYDGGPIGDVAMPDGGYDGGPVGLPPPPQDAGSDASDGGKIIGVGIMPDGGDGG